MRLLCLLLLLFIGSIYAATNEPVPYNVTLTDAYTCHTGDGTYNWNSFGNNLLRGPFTASNPGQCMPGAMLNWPYTSSLNADGTLHLTYNTSNIIFPNLQCTRFYDFYSNGTHYYPNTYSIPPTSNNVFIGYDVSYNSAGGFAGSFMWGMHIIKGFRCIFSCPIPEIQYIVAPNNNNQTDIYSDGNQRLCHPSRINQTSGMCFDQAVSTQTQAPYCLTPAVCTFRLWRFYSMTCTVNNTNTVMSDVSVRNIYIPPGDSCTVTMNFQYWNTYFLEFNHPNFELSAQSNPVSFTMNCPSDISSLTNIEPLYVSYEYMSVDSLLKYGSVMTTCPSGFYGPTCLPCQRCSFYGKCDDGVTGTGKCSSNAYNPCDSRTTNYGLTFTPDASSSTGLCRPSAPISDSYTIILQTTYHINTFPFQAALSLGTVILQNWGSWLNSYIVSWQNRVETLTFIPYPGVDPTKTFCNGRGQLYGSFQFNILYYSSLSGYNPRVFTITDPNNAFISSYDSNPCECFSGFYGPQCQYTCNTEYTTTANQVCDPVTGKPTCALNTQLASNGSCIASECAFNKWGSQCQNICPLCTAPLSRCDKATGQCSCPDPTMVLDRNGTFCTPYHCGINSQLGIFDLDHGTCVISADGTTETMFCNPGYHGKYCEQVDDPYNSTVGMSFKDRDCDCGVVWSDYVPSLDQYDKSITVIGIVSWPSQYRDHYQNADIDLYLSLYDTNSWTVPIIWNRIMTLSSAQQWCYEYRPCGGFLATHYNGAYYFITPFQNNTSPSTAATLTNNTSLYSNLWVNAPNNTVTSGSQVSVFVIQRTLGYDCSTTALDIKYYFNLHWQEIMYDYGTRFCDISHRQDPNDPTSNCCINNGVGDQRYCDYPNTHIVPLPDYVNGPFVQWTQRHYDEIGHRKRYSPNAYCDTWPTLYDESPSILCALPKDGCQSAFNGAIPCSERGRCRPNPTNTTSATTSGVYNHPYKCMCSKFDSSVTSSDYYSDQSNLLNNHNTQGRRKYLGYACETGYNNCIQPVTNTSSNSDQAICNGEVARCVGLTYPANSTIAIPGVITPHCDCNLIKPSEGLYQESVNTGGYCELSRCGIGGAGCRVNSSAALCVVNSQGQDVCQCSVDGLPGDLWIGPSCQIPADSCRPPSPDGSGLYRLCGGPGFGVCMEAGSGISTTPNWNATRPWCDCSNFNYTGLHCEFPLCTGAIVIPFHGYCQGAQQNIAVCYPMWDGPNTQCNINKCALSNRGGGIPTDSLLPGSQPQDICQCTGNIGREPWITSPRPGFSTDPNKVPSSEYGFCHPKCPTNDAFLYPTAYCGGAGYCVDPVHNTPDSIAQCVCGIGYMNSTFRHPQWNTTQPTCVPYCQNGGYVDMTADQWGSYVRNPFTSVQPTCICPNTALGYFNDPETGGKTCIDLRCGVGGIWTPDTVGNTGTCECASNMYNPVYTPTGVGLSGCKISVCNGTLPDGTGANRGVIAADGKTCSCFSPFTNSTIQKKDCNSDICHPNGNLFTTSVYSSILQTNMLVPITTTTGTGLCNCNNPFRTTGCTQVPGALCNQYCTDSSCPNGGTPINNNRANCSCPAPFVSPYCQNPCPQLTSVANATIGKCQCLYGWSDNTAGYCAQDPCNVGCPTGTNHLCGKFNFTTLSCNCFDAWELQGLSCIGLNISKATAECNVPNGFATGPDSCFCGLLWTGSNCNITLCVAPGSNVTYDQTLQKQVCVCPDGYSGTLCDTILLPPPPSLSSSPLLTTADIILTSMSSLVVLAFVSRYGLYPLLLKYRQQLPALAATSTFKVATRHLRRK